MIDEVNKITREQVDKGTSSLLPCYFLSLVTLLLYFLIGCGSEQLQLFHLRYSPPVGTVSSYRVRLTSLVTPKILANSIEQIEGLQIRASATLINRVIGKDGEGNIKEEYEFKDFAVEPSAAGVGLIPFPKLTKIQRTVSPLGEIISISKEVGNFDLFNQILLLLTPRLPVRETFIGSTWTEENTTFIFDHLTRCQGEKCAVITKEIQMKPAHKKSKSRNFLLLNHTIGQGKGKIYYAWNKSRVIRASLELATQSEITFRRKGVESREELNQQLLITLELKRGRWIDRFKRSINI